MLSSGSLNLGKTPRLLAVVITSAHLSLPLNQPGVINPGICRVHTSSSSPLYPRSGGASCADGERVESFVRRISCDPVCFRVRWCVFRSVSFDLQLSSLTMIAALVRWSFMALAQQLPVRLLQQALLRQALSGSGDGGVRTYGGVPLAHASVCSRR